MRPDQHYEDAAEWADKEMDLAQLPKGAKIQRGAEAAAAGRALLEQAMGSQELDAVLGRGKPKLNAGAPAGTKADVRQARMPDSMIQALDALAKQRGVKSAVVIREAVAEYLERNPTRA